MKKKYQVLGFIVLLVCSVIYDYQQPEKIQPQKKVESFVILEGEFLKQGEYVYEGEKTIQDVIDDVGVSDKANLKAISLTYILKDESRIYLPAQSDNVVSLNNASKEELMSIKGVGEKTAQKILDYRHEHEFRCIEDIMNVSGVGEKTYLKWREYLCL